MAEGSVKRIDLAGGARRPWPFLFTLQRHCLEPAGCHSLQQRWNPVSRLRVRRRSSPVTALDLQRGEQAHGRPVFLPDGKHFLYYELAGKQEYIGIYAGTLDAKPAEQEKKRLLDTPPESPT